LKLSSHVPVKRAVYSRCMQEYHSQGLSDQVTTLEPEIRG